MAARKLLDKVSEMGIHAPSGRTMDHGVLLEYLTRISTKPIGMGLSSRASCINLNCLFLALDAFIRRCSNGILLNYQIVSVVALSADYIISQLAGLHDPKKRFFLQFFSIVSSMFLPTQTEKKAFSQLKIFISA